MIRAKVFLDEDLDVIVADILRSRGYEAVCVTDLGRKGFPDDEQLSFAADSGMIILTHNVVDYQQLAVEYFDRGREHAGIIVANRRPSNALALRVLQILAKYSSEEIRNQIIYV